MMEDDFKITQEEWNALKYAIMQACTTSVSDAFEWVLSEDRSSKEKAKVKALIECSGGRQKKIITLVQNTIDGFDEIPDSAPSNTPRKQLGKYRGAIGRFISKKVGSALSISISKKKKKSTKPKIVKITNVSTLDTETENLIFENAIIALKDGKYHELDPVSGDASCEMRVPFLLDVYDQIGGMLSNNPNAGDLAAQVDEIITFKPVMRSNTKKQNRSAHQYFGLCHPLTTMRTQGKDSFLFLVDDVPEKWSYSFKQRGAMKRDLAEYSVDYMCSLANHKADTVNKNTEVLTMERMIANMFNTCRIALKKSSQVQPVLPIYTALRLILMHEIDCGRPITVTLTRTGYGTDRKSGQAVYTHCGSKVFFYRANKTTGTFDLVPTDEIGDEERTQPLTNFHVYNMFDLEGVTYTIANENTPKSAFFFHPDWTVFEDGFSKCDITHLLRCWGAAHPPVPKGSNFEGAFTDKDICTVKGGDVQVITNDGVTLSEFTIDDWFDGEAYNEERGKAIRNYIENCQIDACPEHKTRDYEIAPFELTDAGAPLFGVTADTIDLATEYKLYKELAKDWYLFEAHYAEQIDEDECTYYLDFGKGDGLEQVDKDAYEQNTRKKAHEKQPSGALTKRVFHRIRAPLAFSPVHVFLSSFEQENANLENLPEPQAEYCTAVINLLLVEEERRESGNELVGSTKWDVNEFPVEDPDIEIFESDDSSD